MIPALLFPYAGGLVVTADPSSLFQLVDSASGESFEVEVTAGGGSGSYTYSWTKVSGSPDLSVTSSSSATTTFTYDANTDGIISALFRCSVDDGSGNTGFVDVNVSLSYFSSLSEV